MTVEGNKNTALPLMAACLLTDEECVITNVPRIRDVEVLLELHAGLGATVEGTGTPTLRISASRSPPIGPIPCSSASCADPCCCSVRCWRGAARRDWRLRAATFPRARTISTHLQALVALGAVPVDEPGHALDAPDGLTGASFYLDEASVTGTETALLAAAAAKGRTEIRHAAMEPHVVELCTFLSAMGVSIEGDGHANHSRRTAGAVSAARRIGSQGDYIEAGSWGVVAAITGGDIDSHRRQRRGHGSDRRAAAADGPGLRAQRPAIRVRHRR